MGGGVSRLAESAALQKMNVKHVKKIAVGIVHVGHVDRVFILAGEPYVVA